MQIKVATKNISETVEGYGIIIAIHGENEKWLATFEETEDRNIRLDAPIKVLHKVGDERKVEMRSYQEHNITNDLIKTLDFVIQMFDNAPIETKRVLAF